MIVFVLASCVCTDVPPLRAQAPPRVPAPADAFGFEPGADHHLATHDQIVTYFARLAASSDRIRIDTIGRSVRGRPMILAYISSAENLRALERWRGIAERLALARGLDDGQASGLAREGRAVVWIDSGLHADEVASAQHAPLLAHRMVSDESEEVKRIRERVLLLLMPNMNPDGLDIVTDWTTRTRGTGFETAPLPVLYHPYVGVDINRDWYMLTQPETRAVAYQLYRRWYPQIIYNHHQSPPFPARILVPPYEDPVNPNIPAEVVRGVNLVGAAMAKRFEAEGKPGVVSRVGGFDMWWNGGMRSTPYFHNMIGILTETAGGTSFAEPRYHPPDSLPARLADSPLAATEPSVLYPNPWRGGWWRLRDAVEYMVTGSMGVLAIAAALKDEWLYGIYRMGRKAIDAGTANAPFAYVVPRSQWDSGEAIALIELLRLSGLQVKQATSSFTAGGTTYPAGSFVLHTAQPFRAHLIDLMEPQVYPDRRAYAGGPPEPPYDLSGWTLPLQMGVRVDRIDASFEAVVTDVDTVHSPPSRIVNDGEVYLLSHRANASVTAVNRLLTQGERVSWATSAFDNSGEAWDAGTFIIHRGPRTRARLERVMQELGLTVRGAERASTSVRELRQPRVGLYKSWVADWIVRNDNWSWVANIGEGWTRWVLERHAFPVDTLHDHDIRTTDLARYDAIILPEQLPEIIMRGHAPGTMPAEYTGGIGDEGAAKLKRYVDGGGTIVAIDAAASFAIELFQLPIKEPTATVPREQLFVPGTILRLETDPSQPVAFGMPAQTAAFFVRSRAFDAADDASGRVRVIAWYGQGDPLLSGWALGARDHLAGRPAVVEAEVGRGKVVLIGFRPVFRGQSRATFKLLSNAIFESAAAH